MSIGIFYIDQLSLLMLAIILIVGLSVVSFSRRYLDGDSRSGSFFLNLICLILSVALMSVCDHVILFLTFWFASNGLLVKLMVHKSSWKAAAHSGLIAKGNFIFGFLMIAFGILGMSYVTGSTSIQSILHSQYETMALNIFLGALFLGVMMQSALWPFHKWLISSLNSPTPVSAIMHAGLVNGGGFLLARFSNLYSYSPEMLNCIFALGLLTVILGTAWKLVQPDIKRMLACSTMSQMGFMVMQCGLGLFPAALAHLCFHSFFKAYLFLSSGSSAFEKRLDLHYPPKISTFLVSLVFGLFGGIAFALMSGKSLLLLDTNLILIAISLMASAQCSLSIMSQENRKWVQALIIALCFGAFYGACVHGIEIIFAPLNLMHPQALNPLHIVGGVVMFVLWGGMVFSNRLETLMARSSFWRRLYVWFLNSSQPDSKTITAHRNSYGYL